MTEWEQFRALDLKRLKKQMAQPVIVDLRNIYRPEEITEHGFTYESVGRPSAAKPKREETPREAAAVGKVAKALAEGAPRLKAVKDGDHSRLAPDHPDEVVGSALLMEALGTTDLDFYSALLGQFANVGSKGSDLDQAGANFLLAVVKGIQPRDQIEAMLATQMAAVHAAMMTFARRLAQRRQLGELMRQSRKLILKIE